MKQMLTDMLSGFKIVAIALIPIALWLSSAFINPYMPIYIMIVFLFLVACFIVGHHRREEAEYKRQRENAINEYKKYFERVDNKEKTDER
jgi:fatty acid desaturase